MPKRTIRCGSGHVVNLSKLLRAGAKVELVYKTIAGIKCKQYTIGGSYRLIATTANRNRAQLFVGDYGKNWVNAGLPWSTCIFLTRLLEFREYVFYDANKNNEQEDTEAENV